MEHPNTECGERDFRFIHGVLFGDTILSDGFGRKNLGKRPNKVSLDEFLLFRPNYLGTLNGLDTNQKNRVRTREGLYSLRFLCNFNGQVGFHSFVSSIVSSSSSSSLTSTGVSGIWGRDGLGLSKCQLSGVTNSTVVVSSTSMFVYLRPPGREKLKIFQSSLTPLTPLGTQLTRVRSANWRTETCH